MLAYYILIFFPLAVYFLGFLKGKRNNKICILLFFLILFVLLSLRSIENGIDLVHYKYYFNYFSKLSFIDLLSYSDGNKNEIFFYILNKLVSYFGGSFQLFLTIIAIISIFPIFKFYYKSTNNALLTIALFIVVAPFTSFFSSLRQSIAIGIVVYSFTFVENKKIFKFIFCVIIASLFHRTALFSLPLYVIYNTKITSKKLYFIIPIIFFMFLFNEQIFALLLTIFPSYDSEFVPIAQTGAYGILVLLVLFAVYCFFFSHSDKVDNSFIGLRNILLFTVVIQSFAPINFMAMRINYYYLVFIPILIPKVKLYCKSGNLKLVNLAEIFMFIFFISYFFYDGYNGIDQMGLFPYVPFWRLAI